jgi:hypothetical protein
MISRINRVPTGKTSNRPSTSSSTAPASARSGGNITSSRFNAPDTPHSLHSPIKRPGSKMSQSGSRTLPSTSLRQNQNESDSGRGFTSYRSGGGGSGRSQGSKITTSRSGPVRSVTIHLLVLFS